MQIYENIFYYARVLTNFNIVDLAGVEPTFSESKSDVLNHCTIGLIGAQDRIRTCVPDFADQCLTTRPLGQFKN
jgi:hypothetical protein